MRIIILTILACFLFSNYSLAATEVNHINPTEVVAQKLKSQNSSEGKVIITDIANWNHPVKTVLVKYNIKITKLELTINKTYATFYVHFSQNYFLDDRQMSDELINLIAKANGFWNFTLIDEVNKTKIVVYCNKKDKIVQKYIYNGTRTEILDYGKLQSEYKKYTSILNVKDVVSEIIEEDIDLDGKKELIITIGTDDLQFYVLRENGSKLQMLDGFSGRGYQIFNLNLVKMKGKKQTYIETRVTNGGGLVGFGLYELKDNTLVEVVYSASATGSGEDDLISTARDEIYDGYIQERSSYDVMYLPVSVFYKWNGKTFEYESISVDVGEYPDNPEDVVSQFLKLNLLRDEYKNCTDAIKRLREINLSRKEFDNDKIIKLYQIGGSESDWRSALVYGDLQFASQIKASSATITIPVQNKKITFILSKNKNMWSIIDIQGDFS